MRIMLTDANVITCRTIVLHNGFAILNECVKIPEEKILRIEDEEECEVIEDGE